MESKARILIVEDEGPLALSLQERLEGLGYVVAGLAVTGEEAVAAAEAVRPDVVLMDIRLRGAMDGITAAEQIRDRYRLPVIFLTAFADPATVARAQLTEPFGYLLKPFRERELHTCIEMALYKHRAEQQLRQNAAEIEDLYNHAPCGYHSLDADGRLVRINDTELAWLGCSRAEALGRPFVDFLTPAGREVFAAAFPLLRERGWIKDVEYELVAAGGELMPVLISATAILDAEGRFVMSRSTVYDLRERRQAEQERRQLEARMLQAQKLESLGVLAGGIAHDFNNLLTAILGNADLALLEMGPISPARPCVEQIIEGVRRAAELTNQMLSYAGRSRFQLQPLDLSRLVRGLADLLKVSISREAMLRCYLAADLPPILADPAQLRQVVMNLILNASDALGDGEGTITLRSSTHHWDGVGVPGAFISGSLPAGPCVALEVSDTGCGMSAETLPRIFDPFFTTKFAGRGLGLAAVLGIVRNHRGLVQVCSAPGRGSTFLVLFPMPDAGTAVPAAEEDGWSGEGVILVVDDEDPVRDLARRLVQSLGFEVLTARDGREAVEVYGAHAARITAVLLDLTMPGLDGVATFRLLCGIRPDVVVLLSSGYGEQEAQLRLGAARPAGFVAKPYRLEELRLALRQALQARA